MLKVRMLLASMLIFVFCHPLTARAEMDEAAMMANARSHYQEGGYYFATTWLERVLQKWPKTPQREEVLLMMAKAYVATAREEKALRTVKTLLSEYPGAAGKLDPTVVKFMEESEARKPSPYFSSDQAASAPAAPSVRPAKNDVPAPVPVAVSATPAAVSAKPSAPVPVVKTKEEPAVVPPAPVAPAKGPAGAQAAPSSAPAPAAALFKADAATPAEATKAAPVPVLPAKRFRTPKAPAEVKTPSELVAAQPAPAPVQGTSVPTKVDVVPAKVAPAPPKAVVEPPKAVEEPPKVVAEPSKVATEPAKVAVAPVAPQKVPVEAPASSKDEVAPAAAQKPREVPAQPASVEKKVAATPAGPAAPVQPQVAVPAPPAPLAKISSPAMVEASVPVSAAREVSSPAQSDSVCREQATGSVYVIELGEYVGKNAVVGAKQVVKKAGLEPVVGPGPMKVETMLRIQVGEFTDPAAGKKLLDKLRAKGAEHFVLTDKAGVSRVYAGSYSEKPAAIQEQKKLAAKGFKSELKKISVSVPTFVVKAGCFPTEEDAKSKLAELERLGLSGKVQASAQ